MRSLLALLALGLVAPLAAEVPAPANGVAASVVHVQVFRSAFDWSQPWRQEGVSGASGSGFFIAGGRIVTNAHVIADARQILVRRPDQANPYVATLEAVGNDCDLAVLRVADPEFARGLRPLSFGPLPRSGTRVSTYGFPLGGQDVSSTAGIVSRVESRGYVHSGADAHLVVQTDAAINPGNSGGPVVQDGRVVGVAFQGFPGADNMGFFIPVPVVRHFLANLEDGRYDGFPDSGLDTAPLLSPAYRRERGLPDRRSGVVETIRDVVIDHEYLNFCFAPGQGGRTQISLQVDGKPVRQAVGQGRPKPSRLSWDVSQLKGQRVQLRIAELPAADGTCPLGESVALADQPQGVLIVVDKLYQETYRP